MSLRDYAELTPRQINDVIFHARDREGHLVFPTRKPHWGGGEGGGEKREPQSFDEQALVVLDLVHTEQVRHEKALAAFDKLCEKWAAHPSYGPEQRELWLGRLVEQAVRDGRLKAGEEVANGGSQPERPTEQRRRRPKRK